MNSRWRFRIEFKSGVIKEAYFTVTSSAYVDVILKKMVQWAPSPIKSISAYECD